MLKCLESWNRERWEAHRRDKAILDAHKSGFECPRCKKELWFKDPSLVFGDMNTTPATRDVYCPSCMFIGVQVL